MLLKIRLPVGPLVAVVFLLLMGCRKKENQVLVTIAGKDTIIVSEFKNLLERKYGEAASGLTYVEKRKNLDLMINERLKYEYGCENGFNDVAWFDEDKEKQDILLKYAYDKYIIGHFITDDYLQAYVSHYGQMARVQNIVIRFKSHQGSSVKLTKDQAKRKADSVYAMITKDNFEALAEKNSDYYVNPYSKKANMGHDLMQIGKIPVPYEKELLRMTPNSVSKPIEIIGGYAILRFIGYEELPSEIDIRKAEFLIRSRLEGDDNFSLINYQNAVLDSLSSLIKVRMLDENIQYLLSKLRDTSAAKVPVNRVAPEYLQRPLAEIGNSELSVRDFLQIYSFERGVPSNINVLKQMIKDQCATLLLKEVGMRDGFLESDLLKEELKSAQRQNILNHVEEKLSEKINTPSTSELQAFYLSNRERYRTNGNITWSEIFSSSWDQINLAAQTIKSGVVFEQVPETINRISVGQNVKLVPNYSSTYEDKNELTSAAVRMQMNEISGIIPRKSGGYSIIKIQNKIEPEFLPYQKIKNTLVNEYLTDLINKNEQKLLKDLRNRWKTVVYENNL